MADAETSGAIVARATALMRDNALLAAFAVSGLAAVDTLLEAGNVRQGFALSGALGVIAQYALLVAALRKLGLVGDDERGARILPMLGLLILANLAIVLGLLLLIVPGVILAIRWSIIVPILLAEQVTIGEAMRQSWARTAGRFWPIFGAFAIFLAAVIVASAAAALLEGNFVATFAMNLVINSAVVAMWYAAVAIYKHERPGASNLEDVFA